MRKYIHGGLGKIRSQNPSKVCKSVHFSETSKYPSKPQEAVGLPFDGNIVPTFAAALTYFP